MTGISTATVETLTAEVRVLMVGSRQVTLSVARQLDEVDPDWILPFGRIRTGKRTPSAAVGMIEVIGSLDGQLVRSAEIRERYWCGEVSNGSYSRTHATVNGQDAVRLNCREYPHGYERNAGHFWESSSDVWAEWEALPLIVLAGLR